MTYRSNFTIQMAAILFWQILTLKLIFQLGKQFFQIQHILLPSLLLKFCPFISQLYFGQDLSPNCPIMMAVMASVKAVLKV